MNRLTKYVVVGTLLSLHCAALSPALHAAHRATDAIADANNLYSGIAANRRSDTVLLPLLAKLPAMPKAVETVEQAMLLPATSQAWNDAKTWATSEPAKAVLAALPKVSSAADAKSPFAFGLPYGAEGVSPELVRAELYIDVGDPPTLATASLLYMPALTALETLVNIEATRLAADGKPGDAIDLLTAMTYIGRQMADRALMPEATWGFKSMARCCERIRDIAYVDSQAGKKLDPVKLIDQIKKLEDQNGPLDTGRTSVPRAAIFAGQQIVERVYGSSESVNADMFGKTIARLAAGDKPLRLFGEAEAWKARAATQGTRTESMTRLNGIFADWTRRWTLDWFERTQSTPTAYEQLDRDKYGAVAMGVADIADFRIARQLARVEGVGTRATLAAVGAWYDRKNIPNVLPAVRPRWQVTLEADPYNPNTANSAKPPLEYIIPMKDTPKDDKGQPQAHTVNIIATSPAFGNVNFSLKFRDDSFLIYSWGSDNAKNIARRVQNTPQVVTGADYLIWPPVMSLYRQRLVEQGLLK